MKKSAIALAAAAVLVVPFTAHARLHEVDVANYYFEEVSTGARDPIVVNEGDQIRFTVRQAAYPPHSVVIDEYGIDSGQLLLFERYTTTPLDEPGTYALYCRAHRARGHETTLVVRAAQSAPPPTPSAQPSSSGSRPGTTTSPGAVAPTASTSASPTSGSTVPAVASETPVPSGVDVASDRRQAAPEPDSLAGLLGRRFGEGAPWTSAVWLWLLSAVPIGGAAAVAARRELHRR